MVSPVLAIEQYGLIGNLKTCALVGDNGSIDWFCLPHLESPSVFAGLLDTDQGGRFSLAPVTVSSARATYLGETNILQTRFCTPTGDCLLTDFMPIAEGKEDSPLPLLIRRIEAVETSSDVALTFSPRFDYARAQPSFATVDGGVQASWGEQSLALTGTQPLQISEGAVIGRFRVEPGKAEWFVLAAEPFRFEAETLQGIMERTAEYWENWSHQCAGLTCPFAGPWHDLVTRSGLVLKLLTHRQTGAIAAAPTTSLPEAIGGERNWDYRFSWVRDAAFTIEALHRLGHREEASAYFDWLRSLCREAPEDLKIMYDLHGESSLTEIELPHLAGYRDSRPVRIGNAAHKQTQLDIFGELVNAFYATCPTFGGDLPVEDWQFLRRLIDHAAASWNRPDAGIWEVRGGSRHFVYSKLMCWVALDRGLKIAEQWDLDAPVKRWALTRDRIRETLLKRGFNWQQNTFVQVLDGSDLDATGLLIPATGFLPYDDPRVQGTIDAVLDRLSDGNGLVRRYEGSDGLAGNEGAFVLCSCWLIVALARSGRASIARRYLEQLVSHAGPLGLLAEEIDPVTGSHLGNYPQAFSQLGLLSGALAVTAALSTPKSEGSP